MTYGSLCRQLARFEKAADAYAFRGTIPYGESEATAHMYDAIEAEYEAAKGALKLSFRKLTQDDSK